MQIGEGVSALKNAIVKDEFCNGQKEDSDGWEAELHTINGYDANPAKLRQRMLSEELIAPDVPGGNGATAPWDITNCDELAYPYQTHHVIPKSLLSKEPVCVWLTDSPKKNPTKYKLKQDNAYSVDHWENGYFMPFASTTSQWAAASPGLKRTLVCHEMMRRTKVQLHQGNHASADYAEQDEIETSGYNEKVRELLREIHLRTLLHVEICDVCKEKTSGGKIEVQPVRNVVRYVDMASDILIALIDSYKIFVSKRASAYAQKYRLTENRHNHPAEPLI